MKATIVIDSATISTTEYFLASDSTTATYQTEDCILHPFIDFSNMVAGDQYQVTVYEKVNGGTARAVYPTAVLTGVQASLWTIPPLLMAEGWEIGVKRLAGTDRSIGWTLRKLTEGETVVLGTGAITAAVVATGAIDADAIAADAVTELQSGLALSTQVDALEAAAIAIEADTQDIQSRLPATLVSGRIDASVGAMAANVLTAAATAADFGTEIATAVWAAVLDGTYTAKGMLIRAHAVLVGKATGMLGVLGTFYRQDGSTKAVEATQSVDAGTREAPSTVSGD